MSRQANYRRGSLVTKPQASGGFSLTSYTPGVGAKYDRYSGWWGGQTALDGVDVTYYTDAAAADAALVGGTIDLIGQIQLGTDRSLFNNAAVHVFSAHGATHRQVCMRVDLSNQLKDAKVRQAIALTLARPSTVHTLFPSFAAASNSTPLAPVHPA